MEGKESWRVSTGAAERLELNLASVEGRGKEATVLEYSVMCQPVCEEGLPSSGASRPVSHPQGCEPTGKQVCHGVVIVCHWWRRRRAITTANKRSVGGDPGRGRGFHLPLTACSSRDSRRT